MRVFLRTASLGSPSGRYMNSAVRYSEAVAGGTAGRGEEQAGGVNMLVRCCWWAGQRGKGSPCRLPAQRRRYI